MLKHMPMHTRTKWTMLLTCSNWWRKNYAQVFCLPTAHLLSCLWTRNQWVCCCCCLKQHAVISLFKKQNKQVALCECVCLFQGQFVGSFGSFGLGPEGDGSQTADSTADRCVSWWSGLQTAVCLFFGGGGGGGGGGGVIGVRPRGWQQSVSWQVGILVKWAWSSGQFWAIGVRPRGWQQSDSWQVGILVKWAWSSGQFWAIGVRPRGWQQSVSWQVGILVKWAWSSGQFWAIGVRPRWWQQSVSWQVGILVKWAWSSGQFWAIGARPRGWQQSVS